MDWLGMIADEFEQFELEKTRPAAIRSYELTCNWKLTMDAFLEVYHIKGIHPDTVGPALQERGAVMGAAHGWERPNWFSDTPGDLANETFRRANWFDAVAREVDAATSRVAMALLVQWQEEPGPPEDQVMNC